MREIPRAEAALFGIEAKRNLAFFKDNAIVIAEHREEHPAPEVRSGSLPIDIEIGGERRLLTPFENIEPPSIVASHTHVVRDEVKNQSHAMRVKRIDKGAKIRLAADLPVEFIVIDDVVAVGR